jgi:type I restriction enzyme S subunit
MNAPKFRFKDNDGQEYPDWIEGKLGEIGSVLMCKRILKEQTQPVGDVPFYKIGTFGKQPDAYISNEVYESFKQKYSFPKKGDILISAAGTIGRTVVYDGLPAYFQDSNIVWIDNNGEKVKNAFLHYLYAKTTWNTENTTIARLYNDNLKSIFIKFPSIPEQTKIANFLTAVDEKISQLTQKSELLAQYKKGVMQQIFSQELRFKDDDGREFPEWKEVLLKDISERVKTKNKEDNNNVLTISAQQGLINQKDYFNKSVAAKDLTNYYLLHKGDFAYNKSYSNGYPMGAIKCLNRYEKGIVSTLYICFRFHAAYVNAFFEQYFETGLHNKEIEKVAQEGARNHGLLNIGIDDFFSISLTIPSIKEQTKIANFLSAIDDKITQTQAELDAVKQYKQGLLQQMFV